MTASLSPASTVAVVIVTAAVAAGASAIAVAVGDPPSQSPSNAGTDTERSHPPSEQRQCDAVEGPVLGGVRNAVA